jgi:hypothetical protein
MRTVVTLTFTALLLAGCQKDVEARETADDSFCRKTVAERNDSRPDAYKECRANLMQYHQQKAIAASGK